MECINHIDNEAVVYDLEFSAPYCEVCWGDFPWSMFAVTGNKFAVPTAFGEILMYNLFNFFLDTLQGTGHLSVIQLGANNGN